MPNDKDNVIDLASRRLARLDHVEVRANPKTGRLEQTFHSPTHGDVIAEYTLPQVIDLIAALYREGGKLGTAAWGRWAQHVGDTLGVPTAQARAWGFALVWRHERPARETMPDRRVVAVEALTLALRIAAAPVKSAGTIAPGSADTEAKAWLAHLSYGGEPLADPVCGAACPHVLPWESL